MIGVAVILAFVMFGVVAQGVVGLLVFGGLAGLAVAAYAGLSRKSSVLGVDMNVFQIVTLAIAGVLSLATGGMIPSVVAESSPEPKETVVEYVDRTVIDKRTAEVTVTVTAEPSAPATEEAIAATESPVPSDTAGTSVDSGNSSGEAQGGASDVEEVVDPQPLVNQPPADEPEPEPAPAPPSAYYANCTEARNAGVTPIYRGDPEYRPKLDRDGDGIACE